MNLAAILILGLAPSLPVRALQAPIEAPAQELRAFAGTWERDPERSDDPEEKMQEAFQKMREQRSRGGGPPGGGPGGPPGGGGLGRRGRGGGMPGLGRAADEIHVEVEGVEFRIDDGERVQIYFLDGEKHRRELPDGTKLETVSRRQGSRIVIEEKLDRGKIERKIELGGDERTLVVTTTIRLERMKDPVVIRSVYDRVGDEGF